MVFVSQLPAVYNERSILGQAVSELGLSFSILALSDLGNDETHKNYRHLRYIVLLSAEIQIVRIVQIPRKFYFPNNYFNLYFKLSAAA